MSLPKFTAEVSLNNRAWQYRNLGVGTGQAGSQAVIPQAWGCVCRCVTIPLLGRRCARCCIWPPGCSIRTSC